MSRRLRLWLFAVGAAGVAVLFLAAVLRMPEFGGVVHPLRAAVLDAAAAHRTPNVVSAVNYDQRAIDTFGEETLLLTAVVGAAALLRGGDDAPPPRPPRTMEAVRAVAYLVLPVTLLLGLATVVHGALTPGGGFQGGIVLGTAVHLVYLVGGRAALDRVRPVTVYVAGEAVGTAAFAATGLAAAATGAGFLANVLPFGTAGSVLSAGTVPLLSAAVGIEVASGVVVLLAGFLRQGTAGDEAAG
ncbi:MAG: sodium:proton antiporter [Pseudonocardia sp.]|uniref:MnhB domain-containing protein n=1 Tax=unclassified Pseudonocardia TaxID=2619320 RepID=UPI000868E8CF|nr:MULTISPECIES: MnhB domain-containing protein [unclassified Pseudonocardia]MBN9110849.1 sodium:proton antiporter [Pseudonocardia sp.]ODU26851.1 MAG: sodium:proton antiporter [Pseudonocardia sp. SCN 72-51]ODV05428.1 MAG: sodium:proton antiporter [Pseudonocardia sp. SCN 73-27]